MCCKDVKSKRRWHRPPFWWSHMGEGVCAAKMLKLKGDDFIHHFDGHTWGKVSYFWHIEKVCSYHTAIALPCRTAPYSQKLRCYYIAALHAKFIVAWYAIKLWWLAAQSYQYIGNCGIVWTDLKTSLFWWNFILQLQIIAIFADTFLILKTHHYCQRKIYSFVKF